jgi:hypothetical protein
VRPLILLDIDGVLNVSNGAPRVGWSEHLLEAGGRGAYVEVRDDLPDVVLRLAGAGELVWASGWNDGAPLLFGELVPWLAEVPHLTFPGAGIDVPKLATVQAHVGDRSFAWIDDRLPEEAWTWADARAAPTLLVPVDPAVGLDLEDLHRIEAWSTEVATPAGPAGPAVAVTD